MRNFVWDNWTTSPTDGTEAYGTVVDNKIWIGWNEGTVASNTVNIHSTSDSTWSSWSNSAESTNVGSNYVWQFWVDTPISVTVPPRRQLALPRRESAEEREARVQRELLRHQEDQRREEERRTELELARVEASNLLDSILSDIQRQTLEKEDWFLVVGKSGNIYRIRRGRVGNIDLLSPEGQILRRYCVHPQGHLPNADDLVAQKLHLESNDDHLMEVANVLEDYGTRGEVIDITPHLKAA